MGNEEKMIRLDEKGKGDLGRGETPLLSLKFSSRASGFFFFFFLRTVPSTVTAHTLCSSRDDLRNSGFLRTVPSNTKVFLRD